MKLTITVACQETGIWVELNLLLNKREKKKRKEKRKAFSEEFQAGIKVDQRL